MKASIRLGISVVAVVMLSAAGIMELSAQVFAQPLQPEPQPVLLPQQATVQPAHRAHVLEALGKGDFAVVEKIISDLQVPQPTSAKPPWVYAVYRDFNPFELQATSALATQSGSIAFEELKACGFYPQETRLACVIEIKQQLGTPAQSALQDQWSPCTSWRLAHVEQRRVRNNSNQRQPVNKTVEAES